MANPIHVNGGPHKINTIRQQRQEKAREGKLQFILPMSYVKAKCFHFPPWGASKPKFRNVIYHHHLLTFHSQACMTKLL